MQNNAQEKYERWRDSAEDCEIVEELQQIGRDDAQIAERFGSELAFGTGGLRGVLGAGTARMNVYTVRRATQGLAEYLLASGLPRKAAISYDSRIKSDVFARETAAVLAANGIEVWLYPRLEPTPALSWAVRYYDCGAGVCITASHNPAQYNGYKVYGPDGCQITLEAAERISERIARVDCFTGVKTASLEDAEASGKLHWISDQCLNDYVEAVCALRIGSGAGLSDLKLVYTPLNGTGLECVSMLAEKTGVHEITVVPEQKEPDGRFPTCPYPNPEIREAMAKGLALCETVKPDILLGTDPDCDRCGAAVPDGRGGYRLISGNEMGVILLDFICRMRLENGTMPAHPVCVTTIVSTAMADAVAAKYGVEVRRVLTGFKFIGEQIGLLEKAGEAERFIFGFEESYGYLSGAHVRDKDGVNAVLLICEAAAWNASQGRTLLDALNALYAEHGYYREELRSAAFEGADGAERMNALMRSLRTAPLREIAGLPVTRQIDYAAGVQGLPPANVLEYWLQGGAKLIIRPSGTEPKIKFYVSAHEKTECEASRICLKICEEAVKMVNE